MDKSGTRKTNRARSPILVLAIAGVLLAIWSCTPDSGFNTTADYDVVVTHYDPDADFGTYHTFFLPDSIAYIKDPDDTSEIKPDREIEELILDTVADNMVAYGYQRITEVDEENPPDLFVPVSITTTKWVGWYYPWYPPGWWNPWYPPGWGPWYPGYYPPVVYSYSTGTIFFDLWDFKNADEEDEVFPILWTATINGLLSSDRAATQQRIIDNINQAFKQSWYLDKSE